MTTPAKVEKLWKNIDWKSKEEKFAFYNKYFKSSNFVTDTINSAVRRFKRELIEFIDDGEIKEKDKTRKITIADIKGYVEDK